MKQWKTILIFAVILALLVGVWGVATYVKNKKEAEAQANITPTPALEPFLSYDGGDVAKIKVVNETGTLEFTSEEVSTESSTTEILWRLVSPANPRYNESTVKAKVSYFLLMQKISEITDLSGGLAQFGLDKPIASVELFLKSGDTVKVLFGNKAPRDSAQYCMLEGDDKVYATSNVNADTACLGAISYMDLSVLDGIADKDATALRFKRAKDGLDMSAVSNKDGSGSGDSAVKSTWRITSPVILDADGTGFYAVLGDLLSISAQNYIELNPKDLAQYGLDNPSYEFTVKTDDKEVTCLLGNSAGGDLLYAYSTYNDAVFTATLQVLENIDKPFLEIADSFVNITSIWDIDTLTINIDDTVISCKIKDSKDKTTDSDFKVNGQDANVIDSKDGHQHLH